MAPETAAHTISWVLYCVATHPEVEDKLMQELKEAGMPCDGNMEVGGGVGGVCWGGGEEGGGGGSKSWLGGELHGSWVIPLF